MSNNNDFDKKLAELYQTYKKQNCMPDKEKKALLTELNSNNKSHFNWFYFAQVAMACCAIFMLFNIFFIEQNYLNQDHVTFDANNYAIIEVHSLFQEKYEKEIQFSHQIAHKKASQEYQKAKQLLAQHKQGRLINKADDWFILSCNDDILVQIQASLLTELTNNLAIDKNIQQGDLLAFSLNPRGEIIALLKQSESSLNCS